MILIFTNYYTIDTKIDTKKDTHHRVTINKI